MKEKIFSVALVAVIALGAGWNVMQSENKTDLADLILTNVEALANDEMTGGFPACMKNNGGGEPADNLPICENGTCRRKSGNKGTLDVNYCP